MRPFSRLLLCLFASLAPIFAQAGPFTITTPSALPNATLNSPYSVSFTAANGFGSLTWSLDPGSTLPAGLRFDSGTISGTPTETGPFGFNVTVADSQKRQLTGSFTLQVKPPLVITTLPQTPATAGSSLTIVLTATGGTPPYLFQLASGSQFPSWLRFDPQSPDFLTGIPPAAGTFSFTIQVTDGSQSLPATKLLTIVVLPAISITTTSPVPTGAIGVNYSTPFAATGGSPPYTWSLEGGTLPPGLLLNRTTGVLSGSPTAAGTFNFIVRATDSIQATAAKAFVATIGPTASPGALFSVNSFDFTAQAGGDAPAPQNLAVISQGQPLTFTAQGEAASWLLVGPIKGSTPARIRFSVDQSGLQPGKYSSRGQVNTSDGRVNFVTVTLNVVAGVQKLDVSPTFLRFAGSPSATSTFEQDLMVRNAGGGGPISFQASTSPKSPWLTVQPASGQAGPNAPALLRVVVNTQGLPKGATRGFVRVRSNPANACTKPNDPECVDVPVALLVRDDGPVIGLSPEGVRFDVREGNGSPNSRSVNVINLGTGALNWTADVVDGANWLSLAPGTGSATPGRPSRVSLSANPGTLKAGRYAGLIRVRSTGALNSPKYIVAVLNVRDAAEVAVPEPTPSGLVFSARSGVALDPTTAGQAVRLYTSSSTAVQYQASANTADGADWLAVSPASGSTSTTSAALVTVAVKPQTLAPGVYHGDVTFTFSSTDIRTTNVTLVVLPATSSSTAKTLSAVAGCAPAKLALTQTGLANSFAAPAGWPTPLIVQLNNDCGEPVLNGQVVATFSNGDSPLTMRLTDPDTGLYSATWSPGAITSSMTVTARAFAPTLSTTTADISGAVTVNKVPVVFSSSTRNNLTEIPEARLAPGMVAYVKGSSLAPVVAEPRPFVTTYNGTTVLIGGVAAPLYYVSDGQLNIQIPTELEAGKEYSILVAANGGYALPDSILLAPAQPGVYSFDDGGVRRLTAQRFPDYSLITSASPAKAGDTLTIYLIGMGGTNPPVATADLPPAGTLARAVEPPTVMIGDKQATVSFSGLNPGYVGLYQIDLKVPDGVSGELPVVVSQDGVEANPTFLVVK